MERPLYTADKKEKKKEVEGGKDSCEREKGERFWTAAVRGVSLLAS